MQNQEEAKINTIDQDIDEDKKPEKTDTSQKIDKSKLTPDEIQRSDRNELEIDR
ncbi:hypothetical protein HZC20_00890 [Candidatus Peregrinibacteria bacterium]|nr:hypothetical protein [Candidatus Peregrinibacteria bacterium]